MKSRKLLHFICILFLVLVTSIQLNAQSTGDIAFIGYNIDGLDDFSIVVLADLPASTSIYFTDKEPNGNGGLTSNEGVLQWNTGTAIISAGTVVNFTEINKDTNTNFGASLGILSEATGTMTLSASGESIFAFLGTNETTPTTFLAGIQLGKDNTTSGDITGSGLVAGYTHILIKNFTLSPDGGAYDMGSKAGEADFKDYLWLIADNSNWSTDTANGTTFLPFSTTNFTTTAPIVWSGSTDTNWSNSENWIGATTPSNATDNIEIQNTMNQPVVSSAIEVHHLKIKPGASLTVTENNDITINGKLVIQSNSTKNGSYISLDGNFPTIAGRFFYEQYLKGQKWQIFSSPAKAWSLNSLVDISVDKIINPELATEHTRYDIGYYNNLSVTNKHWNYYTDGANSAPDNIETALAESFKGYIIQSKNSGPIRFNDEFHPTFVTSIKEGAEGENNFNLIGNSYASFLKSNKFLEDHTTVLDSETIWIWNPDIGTNGTYETKVTMNAYKIAPGQGFFVKAKSGSETSNISFNKSYQTHNANGAFLKETTTPKITLILNEGNKKAAAEVFYLNSATTDFDNGYDGELFGGVSHMFSIYTHLVENSIGKNYQIQSLPNSDYQNMTIPIGIDAASNKEIIFSAEYLNLPTGMKIYLEDKLTATFTRLDQTNSAYKVILTEKTNGIGRFYLHTQWNDILSVNASNINTINIYKTSNSNLKITGLQRGKTSLSVFNILGENVLKIIFDSSSFKNIALPKLALGMYIVKLQTQKGLLTKKIILE